MAEYDDLLAAIAATTADYRQGDLAAPTPAHVQRWAAQFEEGARLPLLRELNHVLGKTYFSRKKALSFLADVFATKELSREAPCEFWRAVGFLDIQQGGASQKEMLALFDALLQRRCGYGIADCGNGADTFIYLDDAVFTGNRVRRDLEHWIAAAAPAKAKVHIVSIALHTGIYFAQGKLREAAVASGKAIEFKWWRLIELEDRKSHTASSDVLRPVSLPADNDVKTYVDSMHYKPHLRTPGQVGGQGIFSSDAGRQVLETQLLKAGARIKRICPNLPASKRPLGHSTLETLGFGSTIVTFRNCPNNAPLAFWVDEPWYPLFPRTTNSQTAFKRLLESLADDDI